MFIQKTRERLETIREVAKNERTLSSANRLVQNSPQDASDNSVFDDENSTDSSEFIGLSLDEDEDGSDASDDPIFFLEAATGSPDSDNDSVPRRYFSTLLSTVGLKQVSHSPRAEPLRQEPAPSVVATYLFNPLVDFWHATRKNFNLNYRNADSTTNVVNAAENNDSGIAFNPPDNSTGADGLNSSNDVVVNANTANHSLPFKLNVNTASVKDENDGTKDSSHIERAALAFQNAFYKYSNNNGGRMDAEEVDSLETATPAVNNVGVGVAAATRLVDDVLARSVNAVAQNDSGIDHNGNSSVTTTESPNIQIIQSHQSLAATQQSNGGMMAPNPAESAGIYVLEIVGTVVGLTWGAFSQIQNWLNKN